jgi:hypothetical protein
LIALTLTVSPLLVDPLDLCPFPDSVTQHSSHTTWTGAVLTLRAGGALVVMDLTGMENFQLWYDEPEARAPGLHSTLELNA